jgi:VWFA-related protein
MKRRWIIDPEIEGWWLPAPAKAAMRNPRKYLLFWMGGLCLPVCAQQATAPQLRPPTQNQAAFRVALQTPPNGSLAALNDGQIHVSVTVTNKAGKLVTGLDRGDFTLLDDKHPVEITGFQAWGGARPAPQVHIVLAIDTVNLPYDRVAFAREALGKFLRENGGRLANPVSVLWLTDEGIQVQGPASTDGNALASQLDATEGHLRILNRDAGIWGAIERFQMTVQMLQWIMRAEQGQPGRKLLIWIGPGWPLLDNPNIQLSWKEEQNLFSQIVDITTKLREEQIQLYSVSQGISDIYADLYEGFLNGVKKPGDAYLPDLSIKVLAVESGGIAVAPSNDLKQGIDACVADASGYYEISFKAPQAERRDEFHELNIRVEKPGLKARTVTGYYNQPPAKGR